ncbi:hypothetical protein PoB_004561600 [Plakobranchus ocellatus]|uniref:Uncharacterized protein n=1 Tax=Plakobranchus ocellatus TaxID=259542 RepID=A0AAV4BJH4_9GAST|nr:hypothetical protein PoB_004561600 [Plakobranchus ocellatus]
MAPLFPLSNRVTDVRPGCKTQRIAPTLRHVADLMCTGTKERQYYKTCIVGHVNCCLQCGPSLTVRYPPTSSLIMCVTRLASYFARRRSVAYAWSRNGTLFPLSNRATDVRTDCKTQRIAPTVRQVADLVCACTK